MNRYTKTVHQNFIGLLLFGLLFAMAARTPLDTDVWWHLRAGQVTVETGSVLRSDVFSHTKLGADWVNHSWLGQVILYKLFQYGKYFALTGLVALVATGSLMLVYAQMEIPPIIRAFLIVLGGVVAAPVWTVRPQLFTLLMLGFTGYLIYLYKWRKVDRLWVLIPIFILWSNLHAGYVLGLLLLGAILAGELLNRFIPFIGEEALSKTAWWRLAFFSILGGMAVLINPNGFDMWLIPFKTVGVSSLQLFIDEWASPDFHQLTQQPLLWLIFLLIGVLGFSKKQMDGGDFVTLVIFGLLAFTAKRNFGPFALVALPVIARHLDLKGFLDRSKNKLPQWFYILEAVLLVLVMLIAGVKWVSVSTVDFVEEVETRVFPVGATAWIKEKQPTGQLFNEYNWGGYLIWHLPEYPVYVDGRTDLFAGEVLENYIAVVSGGEGWEKTLEEDGVKIMLVLPDSGLANELKENSEWQLRYEDEISVVYTID